MKAGTAPDASPRSALLGAWRLVRVLAHAALGWLTIALVFPRLPQAQRDMRVQRWAAQALRILGIALELRGTAPAAGPVLLVANHISWLDIIVMHAARHCRFVGKSELRHWPLIGLLTTGAGTLFIERASRKDAMRVVHRMVDSLKAGDVVAVFPEGTTSDGTALLPFHANLVQAAISAGAPVQPVALSYVDAASGRTSFAPCYIDDDTFVGSIWRTVSTIGMAARVNYGTPQVADGRDRRAWAAALREAVVQLRKIDSL